MTNQQGEKIQIGIQRVYVKDLSFESPNAPQIFMKQVKPNISLDLTTGSQKLDEGVFEVSLTVTATAKHEEEVIFIAEVEQAGIFSVSGLDGERLNRLLATYCPNALFPYVREAIDGLTIKGSFPALLLSPVNFEALYEQKMQES